MYISDIIRRSGRSLRQAKARTFLTAAAIAVGTFALTLTLAASNGAQHFVTKIINDNFDPAELIVAKDESIFGRNDTSKPKDYDPSYSDSQSNAGAAIQVKRMTTEDIAQLKNTDGVERVREGVQINLQYVMASNGKKYIGTVEAFNPAQHPELLAGQIPKELNNKHILIPEAFLQAFGFNDPEQAIGKQITLATRKPVDAAAIQAALQQGVSPEQLKQLTQSQTTEDIFTITGVMKKPTTSQPGTELYMYIGNQDALALNDAATKGTQDYQKYTIAYVRVKDGTDKVKLKAVQDKLKQEGYSAQSVEDTQKFLTRIISILQGIVAAFGFIAVIASIFGIVNTMYISVLQRTREIGLMKALGMRKRDIGRLFRFEAAWIGFLGGLIGSVVAFVLGTALNPWITNKLDLGAGERLLIFKFPQVVALIVILMIVAILAGLLPSRKAAKLDPIEALRTE